MIRRVAIALFLLVGLLGAAAILLTFPRIPKFEGFGAFELLSWLPPLTRLAAVTAVVGVAVGLLARRNAFRWLAVFLLIVILLATAILYVPFLALPEPDPGPGRFDELWRNMRGLTRNLLATFVLSALSLAVTRLPHAPANARQAALAVPAIVCTISISIYVLFILWPV